MMLLFVYLVELWCGCNTMAVGAVSGTSALVQCYQLFIAVSCN